MRRALLSIVIFAMPLAASAESISRREGFLTIWQSIGRVPYEEREPRFTDVPAGSPGEVPITYAKARGLLDDDEAFSPEAPLNLGDALVWLLRTRNIADPDEITVETLPEFLEKYQIASLESDGAVSSNLTQEQLLTLMRLLDQALLEEVHEVSLYSEKFHGKGTAFGETFDMWAMTAAHRTFPWNTLVKVTNVENGKSVTIRVNDRGPFVEGRDMDLSLGSFTTIAPREKGKINATFQRLGDASIVWACGTDRPHQQRITKDTVMRPGIPHMLPLGESVTLNANRSFVLRSVTYPDGFVARMENWVGPDEHYTLTPSVEGQYVFSLSSHDGKGRDMTMTVVNCPK